MAATSAETAKPGKTSARRLREGNMEVIIVITTMQGRDPREACRTGKFDMGKPGPAAPAAFGPGRVRAP
ncbi:hypothetical protein GCM10017635_23060 [Paracoccus kondratievae]|uniref:Uncharacterized protein n=1 Tax=Paracoccus kondratievae TaxID=135740 RepID=A0AAD3P0P3_9RHOB|nr:hypothetical protein GCM10017635_23060 [Paracoccus kondratievae]